jgi:hypothetical protein
MSFKTETLLVVDIYKQRHFWTEYFTFSSHAPNNISSSYSYNATNFYKETCTRSYYGNFLGFEIMLITTLQ